MLTELRRLNLPIVENYKLNLTIKEKLFVKPDTSAGSENTFVTNKNNYEKKKRISCSKIL